MEAAGTTHRAGGGNIVPPPPISLHEPSRLPVFLEDVSEVSERRQLPPRERVNPRSRAPSISSRSRYVRVRLPPPPPTFARVPSLSQLRLASQPSRSDTGEGARQSRELTAVTQLGGVPRAFDMGSILRRKSPLSERALSERPCEKRGTIHRLLWTADETDTVFDETAIS